jgi:DNA/RNA-binding domain of Phe-tRNA-synthetase-like protein
MVDREGVISSVLYGPDHRTRITPQTRRVFFAVYAPPGIGEQAVSEHLRDLQENVMLVAPQAGIETLHVYGTG